MTEPSVVVRGEARRSGPPELASLSLRVSAGGSRSAEVTRTLARRSADLQAVLGRFAAGVERSSTSAIRVAPVLGRSGSSRPKGYEGSFGIAVVVHDFEVLSDLIVAATAVEQCEVQGPEWSLRPGSSLHREARLAAVDDARSRAADYAAAFGSTITGLLEISDVDRIGHAQGRMGLMSWSAESAEANFELEPAEQEVTGQLIVRFSISEPDPAAVSER